MNSLALDNKLFDAGRISNIAQDVAFAKKSSDTINFDEDGIRITSHKNLQLHVNCEGALNLYFGKMNIENTELLDESKAIMLAEKLVGDLDFDSGVEAEIRQYQAPGCSSWHNGRQRQDRRARKQSNSERQYSVSIHQSHRRNNQQDGNSHERPTGKTVFFWRRASTFFIETVMG